MIKAGALLVIALDPPLVSEIGKEHDLIDLVERTKSFSSGYKIGLPFILEYGLNAIRTVKETSGTRIIVDFKLADIGDIMITILRKLAAYNVDAVIAHGFIGIEDGVGKLVNEASKLGLDIILVVSMTHKGSSKYIDKHFNELLEDALEQGVHGIVIPANKPDLLKTTRILTGSRLKIYSPGIGVQGAKPGDALCHGADYEIIGRSITRALDPGKQAREICIAQLNRVRECRGLQ